MISPRFAPLVFAFILSGMASFLVSDLSTWRATETSEGFFLLWMSFWIPSWCIAFPVIFGMAPVVRKLVAAITRTE